MTLTNASNANWEAKIKLFSGISLAATHLQLLPALLTAPLSADRAAGSRITVRRHDQRAVISSNATWESGPALAWRRCPDCLHGTLNCTFGLFPQSVEEKRLKWFLSQTAGQIFLPGAF